MPALDDAAAPDDADAPEVTGLLDAWNRGEPGALDSVIEAVHHELHEIASRLFRSERPGHTLQPTAVVNELYLKLREQRRVSWRNRAQLFAVAARLMRRILVDHARRNAADRRGGGSVRISLETVRDLPAEAPEIVVLDHALRDLERRSPRQSRIVEMRVFVGLTLEEIAAVEEISRATVSRDWKTARLFLISWLREPELLVAP